MNPQIPQTNQWPFDEIVELINHRKSMNKTAWNSYKNMYMIDVIATVLTMAVVVCIGIVHENIGFIFLYIGSLIMISVMTERYWNKIFYGMVE